MEPVMTSNQPEPCRKHSSASDHDPHRSPPQPLNVHGYARAVYKYSKLSTGAGYNHDRLARFFSRLLDGRTGNFEAPTLNEDFLTVYRFDRECGEATLKPPTVERIEAQPKIRVTAPPSDAPSKWRLHNANHIKSCHDLQQHLVPCQSDSPGQLLFLKGYPSPEWLGLIGSKYHVDPEFFNRFLDFQSAGDRSSDFSIPSLPTNAWNIVELSLITIGLRDTMCSYGQQASMRTIRGDSVVALQESHHRINRGDRICVGSSMIRDISVLDETHFAIEQRISICMQPPEAGRGWLALIWMDCGKDTEESFTGNPLAAALKIQPPLSSSLLPIINYRPMIGLNARHMSRNTSDQDITTFHTTPNLHCCYGRSLRTTLAARDPFYSLKEVFTLVASSEKQFLNMIELKLEKITMEHGEANPDNLENLRYFNMLLFRHSRRIKSSLSSIAQTDHAKWPKLDDEVAKRARREVEQDFLHLYEHAEALYRRCQEEIAVLMNSMAIAESVKAITQAKRIEKLTFMAFIFVPITFTASFFSTNIVELQHLSLWVWLVMSGVILFLSLTYLLFDTLSWLSSIWRFWDLMTQKIVRLLVG